MISMDQKERDFQPKLRILRPVAESGRVTQGVQVLRHCAGKGVGK